MQSPLLLIDAGNSHIKWALAEADGTHLARGAFAHLAHPPSLPLVHPVVSPPLVLPMPIEPDWSALPEPKSAWISNVADPSIIKRLDALLCARWPHLPQHIVTAQPYQCGVINRYRNYRQLGSDRWAALIGARATYPNEPLLIAILGTATTLNALDADGAFIGGLIAAGPMLMMQALNQRTAQLPSLAPEDRHLGVCPGVCPDKDLGMDSLLGLDTQTSIYEGCWLAQAALIERTYSALQAGASSAQPVRCVLSGGGAAEVRTRLRIAHTYEEHLVLSGLMQIALSAG